MKTSNYEHSPISSKVNSLQKTQSTPFLTNRSRIYQVNQQSQKEPHASTFVQTTIRAANLREYNVIVLITHPFCRRCVIESESESLDIHYGTGLERY